MEIALFQPDIAANAAAAIRLATCFAVPVSIIEPTGFVFDHQRLRRVGMDYVELAELKRWPSWTVFEQARQRAGQRLVLLTTRGTVRYHEVRFQPDDILLGGRESAGVPDEVHATADLSVTVPMAREARSLNLVTALAVVLGEGLRQTDGFPRLTG
ncbi:MAG: tRNA (cytidine(34)-2'-O)-methyltransferase [Geminicoccaceae bacterium]